MKTLRRRLTRLAGRWRTPACVAHDAGAWRKNQRLHFKETKEILITFFFFVVREMRWVELLAILKVAGTAAHIVFLALNMGVSACIIVFVILIKATKREFESLIQGIQLLIIRTKSVVPITPIQVE